MTDKELILGGCVFMLLHGVPKTDPIGKRSRKKVMRAVKKKLAVSKTADFKHYVYLMKKADMLLTETHKEVSVTDDDPTMISPSTFLSVLFFRYPTLIEGFDIDNETLESLKRSYSDTELVMTTVKYTNVLVGKILTK